MTSCKPYGSLASYSSTAIAKEVITVRVKNATREQMELALLETNKAFDDNLAWKDIKPTGRQLQFTLTVKDSKGTGARLGRPDYFNDGNGKQRRIKAACWHAHGEFFEALFKIAPDSEVTARGNKINAQEGNWNDWNIGSVIYPFYHSEACMCE